MARGGERRVLLSPRVLPSTPPREGGGDAGGVPACTSPAPVGGLAALRTVRTRGVVANARPAPPSRSCVSRIEVLSKVPELRAWLIGLQDGSKMTSALA